MLYDKLISVDKNSNCDSKQQELILTQDFRIGLPRMHKEPGERRDFLPNFIARLHNLGPICSWSTAMALRWVQS
jgi:hypothetical protein